MIATLDHVVIRVVDLEQATVHYEQLLGRTPSWRGEHPQWGTKNTLFRLDNIYLELLQVPMSVSGPFARHEGEPEEGPAALAFGVLNAEEFRAAAANRGLGPSALQPGQGRDLISGAVREWTNVFVPGAQTFGLRWFAIQHRCPASALPMPEALGSPAAVVCGVDHVVVRTPNGDRAKALYSDTLGIRLAADRAFPEWGVRMMFFRLGDLTLEFAEALGDTAASQGADGPNGGDCFWGMSFRVGDADAARERLLAAGIETSEVRQGRRPGTRVVTIKGAATHSVPTLFVEPAAK